MQGWQLLRWVNRLLIFVIVVGNSLAPAYPPAGLGRVYAQEGRGQTAQAISITADGFAPAEATISLGVEVVWTNNTQQTVVLQSGTPPPGQRVYLALVQGNGATAAGAAPDASPTAAAPTPPVGPAAADFTATLAPGAEYRHTFPGPGTYPFYLANAPQFTGRVIVKQATAATATATATATKVPTPTPTATTPLNRAPVLATLDDQAITLGSAITLTLSAHDPDNDLIRFSAEPLPLPNNATLDAVTGRFSFRPESARTYEITFVATDSKGSSDRKAVTFAVTAPPSSVTSLRGRVLDTNDFTNGKTTPIVNARISLLNTGVVTFTDASGFFTLEKTPNGAQILDIDVSTANLAPNGAPYAGFREGIDLIAGVMNVVDRPFYLPRLAAESLTTVNPNADTAVSNPTLKISMVVPPNTARSEDGNLFSGQLSISPVPENLAPAALPPELNPALLITIQPVGVTFDQPVPLTFPNTDNLPPGTETDIWSLDPELGAFVIVGTGKVSPDGQWINTISGGVRAADWHLTLPPQLNPDNPNNDDNQDPDKCCDAASGSNTALADGNLEVDHNLVGYQSLGVNRALRLIYNSGRAAPRPVVGSSVTIPSRSAVPDLISAKISVSGVQQGSEVFVNTAGLDESTDETVRQAVQVDAGGMATGLYPYRMTLTSHFGASAVSSVQAGRLLIHNMQQSEFGAGWGLDGVYRLHEIYSGDLLLTEGNGGATLFNRRRAAGELLAALAESGIPADRELPSANIGQTIAIFSDPPSFTEDTTVFFTTLNDNGVAGSRAVAVQSVSDDGKAALVVVPDDATSGPVYAEAGREAFLQIVPRLTGFTSSAFEPDAYLYLHGSGFADGRMSVFLGSVRVTDSNPNGGVNVYNANTDLEMMVPLGAGGVVSVTTEGGRSELLTVGPALFSGIVATATLGIPATGGQPSANPGQAITLLGQGLSRNTVVIFPSRDDNGLAGSRTAQVQSAGGDGRSATVTVPDGAVTGDVTLFGSSGAVRLQIVPRLDSFSNYDFAPSGTSPSLQLLGHGFVEGNTDLLFGAVLLVDPDSGPNTIDVASNGAYLSAIIPANAQGLLRVRTAGGTSNSLPVGPTSFTGLQAAAALGTPANSGQPSANVDQAITLLGDNLGENTNAVFVTKNENGATGSVAVRVQNVSADRTSATVLVPDGAVTGNVSLFGASGAFNLQIVPTLDSFNLGDFRPSGASRNLYLYGSGFVEGGISLKFGDVTTVDPNTGSGTIDVHYQGQSLDSIIPNNAKGNLQVVTGGGSSNILAVGPTGFTGIAGIAATGVPSTTAQPSANVGQTIVVRGAELNAASNVYFASRNDDGVAGTIPVRVTDVMAGGLSANVRVPEGAVTGPVTLFGASGSFPLQVVPLVDSFYLGDFYPSGTSRNLTVYGAGFAEGKMTVHFGDAPVVDPNTGTATVDVFSSGTGFSAIVPNNAQATLAVQTDGGVSAPLIIGPTGFSAIEARAILGTPANPGQPSANGQQKITLFGVNLTPGTNVLFPTVNESGVAGVTPVRVDVVGGDNRWATVVVPNGAKTGHISFFGVAGSLPLQIVPSISAFSYSTFSQGDTLYLYGGGYVEGATTVHMGGASVADPSNGSATLDVYGAGTGLQVTVPAGAGPLVSVETAGGVSNAQHMTSPNGDILTPAQGAQLPDGLPVLLSAQAGDNSSIASLDFLVDGVAVATGLTGPYQTLYTPTGIGSRTISLRAFAADGGSVTRTVTVTVVAPTLTISATADVGAPANPAQPSANTGQQITLSSQQFTSESQIIFPMRDGEGAAYTENRFPTAISADGRMASVAVPEGAISGALRLAGSAATAQLQLVPTLRDFSLADFAPSGDANNLGLTGSGFAEGAITLLFGAVALADPNNSWEGVDVHSTNTGLNAVIPENAGGSLRVQTAGGLSNPLRIGPSAFGGLGSRAALGTAANPAQPSANVGQRIVISGTHLNGATNVIFPGIDAEGVATSIRARVESVAADGGAATVVVPNGATSGDLRMPGASESHFLQIVPHLRSFSNYDFAPSGESRNLNLNGGGFVEGATTVHYGPVPVADPDAGYNTLDVFGAGDALNVIIPDNAGGAVSVTTAGGTSNLLQVGPAGLTSLQATARLGVPTVGGQPSANAGQLITLVGSHLGANSNVRFKMVNDAGVEEMAYVRVSSVSADRSRAAVEVPHGAATGDLSLFGATGAQGLQIVPTLARFYNNDFLPSGSQQTLQLEGSGFVEGQADVAFGDVLLEDPDAGERPIDVWNAGRLLYTAIPDNAKGLVRVTTHGGTSNALAVGPTAFTGLESSARRGEAANPGQPSANAGQIITLRGENLNPNTVLLFPTLDDNGVPGSASVRISGTSADGRSATVQVPDGAISGPVGMAGANGAFFLQIVPVIDDFFLSALTEGNVLFLYGRGFVEGASNVRFGSVVVNDPDSGPFQVDSYGAATRLNVTIPAGAQSRVRVSTPGGVSNSVEVAPPAAPTEYPQPQNAATGLRFFVSPDGDFSTIAELEGGGFVRTLKDGTQFFFNAAGLHTSTVDRNGNTTTFGYDGSLRLTSITDPVGLKTSFAYANNRVSTITDPTGRITRLAYDGAGNLVSITDPDSSVRYFGYDSRHRMTAQTSKRGFVTDYQYNFAGMHVKSLWPDGSTRVITPAMSIGLADLASGIGVRGNPAPVVRPEQMVAQFQDGNRGVTSYRTDRFGAGTEAVDPIGRRVVTTRDENGNPVQTTQPNGVLIGYTFDARGNLTEVREGVGTALERSRRFEYEPIFSLVTQIVDAGGFATTIDYDAKGNIVKITDPLNGVRSFTYNSRGQPLAMTDEAGRTTSLAYDAKGNLQTVTDPLGVVTEIERNAAGEITGLIQAKGTALQRKTTSVYDGMNRRISLTDAAGAVESYIYDAEGNLLEYRTPTGERTSYGYDSLNRPVSSISPIEGTSQFFYDPEGNIVRMVDGTGANTFIRYDAVNRPVQVTSPVSGTLRFVYDVQDNLLSTEDARGKVTRYTYDSLSRQIGRTNPLQQSYAFTYDARDLLLSNLDPKGQLVRFSYDGLGRRVKVETPEETLALQYDGVGNLLLAQDGDSKVEFAYDGMNRQVQARTVALGGQPTTTVTRTFDALGRRVRLDDSAGGVTQFGYTVVDYLATVQPGTGSPIQALYDAGGRPTQLRLGSAAVTDYLYDANGRLASLSHNRVAGGAIFAASFQYNEISHITQMVEGSSRRQFTYDPIQRVLSGGVASSPESYTYDLAGNRLSSFLSSAYTVDDANRLLADDQFTYSYDANGNLASRTRKSDNARTNYTFNALDQLVRVEAPGGAVASYRYDALGRRIEKNVGGQITRYVYNGLNILLEYDGNNQLRARYTHGEGVDEILAMERGGAVYYYLADHLGSVRRVVDAAGNTVNSYEYDSYGRRTAAQEGVVNPFGYTGREFDPESGFYYYRARYYDPQTGRFLSEDPIGLAGGDPNLYNYVRNNPANTVDPSGLFSFWDALDVISFGMSLYDFIKCPSLGNGLNLALDTIGLLPLIPGIGTVRRGAQALDGLRHADDAGDALRRLNDIPCSFAPETLVTTAEGMLPIAQVQEGDYVLAYDEETGRIGYYPVSAAHSAVDPVLIELNIAGERVLTTPIHPFYALAPGVGGADRAEEEVALQWVLAGELRPGDWVAGADGRMGQVRAVRVLDTPTEMFDLTVEDAHSFFVGAEQWLVHNCSIYNKPPTGKRPSGYRKGVTDQVRAKNNGKCVYCGGEATSNDHVKPWKEIKEGASSRGEEIDRFNDVSNLDPACIPCNSSKGAGPAPKRKP